MNSSKELEKAILYWQAVKQHINDGHARVMYEEVPKQDKIRYFSHNAVLREFRATIKFELVWACIQQHCYDEWWNRSKLVSFERTKTSTRSWTCSGQIMGSSGRSQGGCQENGSSNEIKTLRPKQLQIFMERVTVTEFHMSFSWPE